MPQEGWAVWEGAARQAGQQYDWVVGQGLSPLLGPQGSHPARRPGGGAVSSASLLPRVGHRPGATLGHSPHRPARPTPLMCTASSSPRRTHGKHPTCSLCTLVLARRLTVSSTNCPEVWCWVLYTRYPCSL